MKASNSVIPSAITASATTSATPKIQILCSDILAKFTVACCNPLLFHNFVDIKPLENKQRQKGDNPFDLARQNQELALSSKVKKVPPYGVLLTIIVLCIPVLTL